jgi:HNH endonuclease/AP2 domain
MIKIPLTQGKVALVDDEDDERVSSMKWFAWRPKLSRVTYAVRSEILDGKRQTVFMHRFITGIPKGMQIDHINQDGLDNRRQNLRPATSSQNRQNRKSPSTNKSGYKGVSWCPVNKKWRVVIRAPGRYLSLGYFKDKIEAAIFYDAAAIKHHGEFACLNFREGSVCP